MTKVPLEQVLTAMTCLMSTFNYEKLPAFLNSEQIRHAWGNMSMGCEAQTQRLRLTEVTQQIADLRSEQSLLSDYANDLEAELPDFNNIVKAKQAGASFCDLREGVASYEFHKQLPPTQVKCESNEYGKNWMLVGQRSTNFVQHSDSDYNNGFGDVNAEFFIGLERLHVITQKRLQQLLIVYEEGGVKHYELHDGVAISGKGAAYKVITRGYVDSDGAVRRDIFSFDKFKGNEFTYIKMYLRPTKLK